MAEPIPTPEALVEEMRMIARVAGQCSVEGPELPSARMAAAEADRASRWADAVDALLTAQAQEIAQLKEATPPSHGRCTCGGVMFGDGGAHASDCPAKEQIALQQAQADANAFRVEARDLQARASSTYRRCVNGSPVQGNGAVHICVSMCSCVVDHVAGRHPGRDVRMVHVVVAGLVCMCRSLGHMYMGRVGATRHRL